MPSSPHAQQLQLSYIGLENGSDDELEREHAPESALLIGQPTARSGAGNQVSPGPGQGSWLPRFAQRLPHLSPRLQIPLVLLTAAALYIIPYILLLTLLPSTQQQQATVALSRNTVAPTQLHTLAKDVTRVAFGSCTAYDTTYQVIWEKGVIPSQPDAWIWVGDMAYLDNQMVDCALHPDYPGCICEPTWLQHPPYECAAGDVEHAAAKWRHMLTMQTGYQAFLDTMCPGALGLGLYPPPGVMLDVCPRPVLGIYDDHDYGWNNGNRRLPQKWEYKSMYLDAIGEPAGSPRRNRHTGAQWQYTLNAGSKGKEIDIILLDGRYDRDPLPCEVRRDWCNDVLQQEATNSSDYVWCRDFSLDMQPSTANGSCCSADEMFANGWCKQAGAKIHPLWSSLCDPTHPDYAQDHYVIRNGEPVHPNPPNPEDYHNQSPVCEMLGARQRKWLKSALRATPQAPLHLIVSGSVLLGSPAGPGVDPDPRGPCGGDDWECYKPAQAAFVADVAAAAANAGGCWVLLVGDYHQSDIKVISGDISEPLQREYQTAHELPTPLYQVMASGMTNSTANPFSRCEGWRKDALGLRPKGECAFVNHPAFGLIEVDWSQYELRLQIRFASNSSVAQEFVVNLATCLPLKK